MRSAVLILALALAPVVRADEGQAPVPPPARLEAAERTYAAGKVSQGAIVRHTFVLKNVGAAELKVDAKPG